MYIEKINVGQDNCNNPYVIYKVVGTTDIYDVCFSKEQNTCSCLDFRYRKHTCKHLDYILTSGYRIEFNIDVKEVDNKFEKAALDIAKLVKDKNEAYGDSFTKSAEFLKDMYPNGITKENYLDAIFIARMYDKMHRIATNKGAFNEDPYKDIAGYALLRLIKQE